MNKKIKEKLDSWDLKSALLTVFIFSIIIFFFVYFGGDLRDRFRQTANEEFKGRTKGSIISIEPIDRINHSKTRGTEIYVYSYKVLYNYRVNGQTFQKIDIIPLTMATDKFLKKILHRKTTDVFVINFDLKEPKRSMLSEN